MAQNNNNNHTDTEAANSWQEPMPVRFAHVEITKIITI